jgi:hypothetical protein
VSWGKTKPFFLERILDGNELALTAHVRFYRFSMLGITSIPMSIYQDLGR